MKDAAYRPTDTEVAHLINLLQMPGYDVLRKIMVGEIDGFQVDLMNIDPLDEKYESKVRVHHNLALSAGMFYERVNNKVRGYINDMKARQEQKQVLEDQTESILGY